MKTSELGPHSGDADSAANRTGLLKLQLWLLRFCPLFLYFSARQASLFYPCFGYFLLIPSIASFSLFLYYAQHPSLPISSTTPLPRFLLWSEYWPTFIHGKKRWGSEARLSCRRKKRLSSLCVLGMLVLVVFVSHCTTVTGCMCVMCLRAAGADLFFYF